MNTIRSLMAALMLAVATPVLASDVDIFVKDGYALGGTDPVSYFADGKPVPGAAGLEAEWKGVKWRFATEANRTAFLADPAKYAPQYGGFCATGTSFGRKVPTASEQYKIVSGKLYLNSGPTAQSMFLKDESGTISKADSNWTKIQDVPAGDL